MMKCDDIREKLSPFIEEELADDVRTSVQEHLDSCEDCRAELEFLQKTVHALRSLPELPAPAGILKGVRKGITPVPWYRRLFPAEGRSWGLPLPAGVIASLLAVMGILLIQERFPEIRKEAELYSPPPPAAYRQPPPPIAPFAEKDLDEGSPITDMEIADVREAVQPADDKAPAEIRADETAVAEAPSAPLPVQAGSAPPSLDRAAEKVSSSVPSMAAEKQGGAAEGEPHLQEPASAPVAASKLKRKTESKKTVGTVDMMKTDLAPLEERSARTRKTSEKFRLESPPEIMVEDIPLKEEEESSSYESSQTARAFRPDQARQRVSQPAVPAGGKYTPFAPPMEKAGADIRSEGFSVPGAAAPAMQDTAGRRALLKRAPGNTEILYLVSPSQKDEMDVVRNILRKSGGGLLEVKSLDAFSSQQAVVHFQDQLPRYQEISRGWQVRAKVPNHNVEDFIATLRDEAGFRLLQRTTGPPMWRTEPLTQNMEINIVR